VKKESQGDIENSKEIRKKRQREKNLRTRINNRKICMKWSKDGNNGW
jgi:hypothetical protein